MINTINICNLLKNRAKIQNRNQTLKQPYIFRTITSTYFNWSNILKHSKTLRSFESKYLFWFDKEIPFRQTITNIQTNISQKVFSKFISIPYRACAYDCKMFFISFRAPWNVFLSFCAQFRFGCCLLFALFNLFWPVLPLSLFFLLFFFIFYSKWQKAKTN